MAVPETAVAMTALASNSAAVFLLLTLTLQVDGITGAKLSGELLPICCKDRAMMLL